LIFLRNINLIDMYKRKLFFVLLVCLLCLVLENIYNMLFYLLLLCMCLAWHGVGEITTKIYVDVKIHFRVSPFSRLQTTKMW